MSDTNVAQDQIKAYVDRILRMKEEADAIASDIKEIYAEAKANGFDKTQLGNLVTYLRKKDKDAEKVAEGEAIFDLYLTAYLGASGKVGMKPATHAYASEASGIRPQTVKLLNTVADGIQTQAGRDALITALDVMIEREEQSNPKANTSADGDATEQDVEMPADSVTGEASRLAAGRTADAVEEIASTLNAEQQGGEQPESVTGRESAAPVSETDKSVKASASAAPASKYAEPGIVTWETFPPEGVERGAISAAFGWAGQDSAVIADDLEKCRAQPIVKKGNVILDGWARYMAARDMRNLDGSPLAYPVVQYDGNDLLVDIIKLNVDGRILTEDQKRKIAANLARQEPSRKDDIYKAFELWMEPV